MYSTHPSIAYILTILTNLPKTTGKSAQEWLDILALSGVKTEKELQIWLIKNYKLGNTTAAILAEHAIHPDKEHEVTQYLKMAPLYVEKMYQGPKEHLRPLHDALIELALSQHPDIKVSPCKTIIPLYRNHVIAQIKPATRQRIDFGLCLKTTNKELPKRLIETDGGSKGDRITHRFEIRSFADIDKEVALWLNEAYDLDKKLE